MTFITPTSAVEIASKTSIALTNLADAQTTTAKAAFHASATGWETTSFHLSSEETAMMATPQTTFEPVLPDTSVLVGMGSIVILSAVAVYVWANLVVPVSRSNLAISKNRGEVKEYLDELQNTEDRALERWMFTDWLQSPQRGKPGRQKEPAIPILKNAKWNSGDNPVLVATALISLCVTIASVAENASKLLSP